MKTYTELPWKNRFTYSGRVISGGKVVADFLDSRDANAAVHAVNAYPKLVEALKEMVDGHPADNARALLKELGE